MKKLISKFIQWTCVLGTLSIPVLAHAGDQALIKGQLMSEVQNTERDLLDVLGNHGQKYTVQENQPVFGIIPCIEERMEVTKYCVEEETYDSEKCKEAKTELSECKVLEAFSHDQPPHAHTEN